MDIKTHKLANKSLLGTPISVIGGKSAIVELVTDDCMVVDDKGLVHGGFTYGLADYAAMLTVNHPNVVLGGSKSRFIAPVRMGEKMMAEAHVESAEGRKHVVNVTISVSEKKIFEGVFTCYVLDSHVLDKN
jgi:acyl-coenzyme A thioesterase PaaI-like protein